MGSLVKSSRGLWKIGAMHLFWQDDCQWGLWWENKNWGLAICFWPSSPSKHVVIAHIGGTFWTCDWATFWWISHHQQLSGWYYFDWDFLNVTPSPEWDSFSLQNIHLLSLDYRLLHPFGGFLLLNWQLHGYQMPKGVLYRWVMKLELVLDAEKMQRSPILQVLTFLTSNSGLHFENDTLASPNSGRTRIPFPPIINETDLKD